MMSAVELFNKESAVIPQAAAGAGIQTQSVALPLPGSGWVIDTPGIRSFGLAHVNADDVMQAFSDLAEAIEDCPRGCGHLGPPADPECALDALTGAAVSQSARIRCDEKCSETKRTLRVVWRA